MIRGKLFKLKLLRVKIVVFQNFFVQNMDFFQAWIDPIISADFRSKIYNGKIFNNFNFILNYLTQQTLYCHPFSTLGTIWNDLFSQQLTVTKKKIFFFTILVRKCPRIEIGDLFFQVNSSHKERLVFFIKLAFHNMLKLWQ